MTKHPDGSITLTDAERWRLLHAYESLLAPFQLMRGQMSGDQRALMYAAAADVRKLLVIEGSLVDEKAKRDIARYGEVNPDDAE